MQYDVFNGDADGVCALHQLRLVCPIPETKLITGVKRDITLLEHLTDLKECSITVLDISLDKNRPFLLKLLKQQNKIFYADHHFAGDIPECPFLETLIDPSPDTCTSLIVHHKLGRKNSGWAICGAFGDNLYKPAAKLANECGYSAEETASLRMLGNLLNYNGYGPSLADLHFHPAKIYQAVSYFKNPLDFIKESSIYTTLIEGYQSDMEQAMAQKPFFDKQRNRIYRFPDTPWARRISGVFANIKAREREDGAHALITSNPDLTLRISVRAPLTNCINADTLCRAFKTGGGRAAAAGINSLPEEMLDTFIEAFNETYSDYS